MRKKSLYDTIVALPHEGCTKCIVQQLNKHKNLRVIALSDSYDITQALKSEIPDLVITSPIVLSDPLLPLVKNHFSLAHTKFIAYCTTIMEEEMIRHYDAKILVTDSGQDLEVVVENALALDVEQEDEQLLTPREKEVVIAVVKGMTNKEIAEELCLSTHTIITHRRNIARKLDIHSPSGLTIYAIMNKLVELEDIMK